VPRDTYEVSSDESGNLTSFTRLKSAKDLAEICTNIIVFDRALLLNSISEAITEGYTDFYGGIIGKNLGKLTVKNYKHKGTYMLISSLPAYFDASMKLLGEDVRHELFENAERPVYTKVRNSPPTLYLPSSRVRASYIADGCVIEGCVENSILFRGVRVGRGSTVKNSILLQDTDVGEGVSLNCVITDKNVTVRGGRVLSGHESIPFFLSKGSEV
jgi:glucose-1-phosphate adenylyltransferase